MLNHLAMETARSLFQWLEIPCDYRRDRPPISLWGVLDFSDLAVLSDVEAARMGGQILCRPVILPESRAGDSVEEDGDDRLVCELPLDVPEDTVACVPVGFDESLKQAWVWGYVPVAGFEVGVRGTRAFQFGAVPWRSLEALAADLKRWTRLSQELCSQTDLCDRLSALVGPVPLASLMARWPRSPGGTNAGASLLTQYWRQNQDSGDLDAGELGSAGVQSQNIDPLNTPFDALVYPEDEDYDDYEVLDGGDHVERQLAGRVRDSSKSSATYRVDKPGDESQPPVLDAPGNEPMTDELEAIAQDLDQWFRVGGKLDGLQPNVNP